MPTPSVGSILIVVSIVACIVLLKIVICSCLLHRRRRDEDRIPILEESLVDRLHEIHQTRMRARRAREPPPTFEDALINSRPVSYIELEEPPPSYDEYLKRSSPDKNSYLDYSPSANPTDILIPMNLSNDSFTINLGSSSSHSSSRDSGLESESNA